MGINGECKISTAESPSNPSKSLSSNRCDAPSSNEDELIDDFRSFVIAETFGIVALAGVGEGAIVEEVAGGSFALAGRASAGVTVGVGMVEAGLLGSTDTLARTLTTCTFEVGEGEISSNDPEFAKRFTRERTAAEEGEGYEIGVWGVRREMEGDERWREEGDVGGGGGGGTEEITRIDGEGGADALTTVLLD